MPCLIVTHPDYQLHQTGVGHPESPKRVSVINAALQAHGLLNSSSLLVPRPASREELELCHKSDYIGLVYQEVSTCHGVTMLSTGDVVISPSSWDVALLSAGGALTAVDVVMEDRTKTVFAALRPPGHHATSDRGMGFCLFNNVAIAARYAQKRFNIERVAVIDWDVHHGNGTQDIFYHDPTVFYFSVHQWPQYPGTGRAEEIGAGNILNCPIPSDERSRLAVKNAFQDKLLPAMKKFKPELIFISAGFDGHTLDPLGGWNLEDADFVELTQTIVEMAKQSAQCRIISVLEGGYSLPALTTVVPKHVQALST